MMGVLWAVAAFYFTGWSTDRVKLGTRICGHSLTSALESLDDDKSIEWVTVNDASADAGAEVLPLYPLPTVYLPGHNYTLNNVQTRNLQMALDLSVGGRFVSVLRTIDTGRLAAVGTVLEILELDPQYREDGVLRRIVVTCHATEVVRIQSVVNPEALELSHQLRNPYEYASCTVEPVSSEDGTVEEGILDDYREVRDLYMSGVGTHDDDHWLRQQLTPSTFPEAVSHSFWETAHLWQTLCATIRTGYQLRLQSDRNELLIDAALRKGGPLELPIHLEDLDPEDRRPVYALEQRLQQEWIETGLDPCLDFQRILQGPHRSEVLANLIRRERGRLERLAEQTQELTTSSVDQFSPPGKGAWFDDSLW